MDHFPVERLPMSVLATAMHGAVQHPKGQIKITCAVNSRIASGATDVAQLAGDSIQS
jgi:hypothetical protein